MSIRVHRKAFLAITLLTYPRRHSLSRIFQFFDINCGLFMRLHFTFGCYNRRQTSRCRHFFSAEFKTFLLIMCIDAPESTTNSLSSGSRFDGAARHQFSKSEKNAVLLFSFYFWIFLAKFHAASRAHRSGHSVSS